MHLTHGKTIPLHYMLFEEITVYGALQQSRGHFSKVRAATRLGSMTALSLPRKETEITSERKRWMSNAQLHAPWTCLPKKASNLFFRSFASTRRDLTEGSWWSFERPTWEASKHKTHMAMAELWVVGPCRPDSCGRGATEIAGSIVGDQVATNQTCALTP